MFIRKPFAILILLIVFALVAYFIMLKNDPRPELWCEHYDIDIKTGRYRMTSYAFYIKLYERIVDTPVSKLVTKKSKIIQAPEWRRDKTLGDLFMRRSRYKYHGAIAQLYALDDCWFAVDFTEKAKYESAMRLLQLWQLEGYDSAEVYLIKLSKIVNRYEFLADNNHIIDSKDLPDD